MYTPKHFAAYELVPKTIFSDLGDSAILVFDNRILQVMDQLREFFGKPIIVNDWKNGGSFEFRGFRPQYYVQGAKYSQHRFGRALDFNVKDMTDAEVQKQILLNQKKFPLLTAMEKGTVGWSHIDCRNCDNTKGVQLFNP